MAARDVANVQVGVQFSLVALEHIRMVRKGPGKLSPERVASSNLVCSAESMLKCSYDYIVRTLFFLINVTYSFIQFTCELGVLVSHRP